MAPTTHRWPSPDVLFESLLVSLEENLAPGSLVALPTGGTPLPLYAKLRKERPRNGIWQTLHYLQLDEYLEEPVGSERFAHYLCRELLDPLNIPAAQRHLIPFYSPDATTTMDARLASNGPLAFALLGLGHNGHIAFNEPADTLPTLYHRVRLSEDTVLRNLPALAGQPVHAVTISVDQILSAKRVVMVVTQKEKRPILERALAGPPSPHIPASYVCEHPNAEIHTLQD